MELYFEFGVRFGIEAFQIKSKIEQDHGKPTLMTAGGVVTQHKVIGVPRVLKAFAVASASVLLCECCPDTPIDP